jgi:hypothetical protein
MNKPKLKLKGKRTYQNTHGTKYRVRAKPKVNYKVMRKNLKMQKALSAQPKA